MQLPHHPLGECVLLLLKIMDRAVMEVSEILGTEDEVHADERVLEEEEDAVDAGEEEGVRGGA